jgi:hypothetical protein
MSESDRRGMRSRLRCTWDACRRTTRMGCGANFAPDERWEGMLVWFGPAWEGMIGQVWPIIGYIDSHQCRGCSTYLREHGMIAQVGRCVCDLQTDARRNPTRMGMWGEVPPTWTFVHLGRRYHCAHKLCADATVRRSSAQMGRGWLSQPRDANFAARTLVELRPASLNKSFPCAFNDLQRILLTSPESVVYS